MLKNISFQNCNFFIRLFKFSTCNTKNMCLKIHQNYVKASNDIHLLNYGLKSTWFHTSTVVWKKRKTKEEKKYKNIIQFNKSKPKYPTIQLWQNMTVSELAEKSSRSIDDVFEAMLFVKNCENYNAARTEIDDINILHELARKLGYRGETIKKPGADYEDKVNKDITKRPPPAPHQLVKRPPVVTIMGHVDHGKTTLLDSLRHTSVAAQEYGGITQHIGAFTVNLPEGQITFLDTPGHAAFSAMRARGANVTDIVVLVVAADDGIMEQTVESIRYAKEANVPVIVAINKIDKPRSDIEEVKRSLITYGILLEEFGGEVQSVCISALKGTNLNELIDAILTQAEIMAVSADPEGLVEGVVLEASMDSGRGKLSTALIQRGTLRKTACLVAGAAWAKVRAMIDERGNVVHEAKPGFPVQIIGWKNLPSAGDEILEAESEKHAHEIIRFREAKKMQEKMKEDSVVIKEKQDLHLQKYKQELNQRRLEGWYRKRRQIHDREKEIKDDPTPYLAIVLKGDVDGSVEAILDVLYTYHSHHKCRLDLVHYGVGEVTENDVELAKTFNGLVYCFNVKVPLKVLDISKSKEVPIKTFNVIYHLVEDLKKEISSKLPFAKGEEIFGEASVLKEFIIKDGKRKMPVAGCRCVKGFLKRQGLIKVIRSHEIIYEGISGYMIMDLYVSLKSGEGLVWPLLSLRREKNEVDTIKKDVECGLRLQDPEVRFFPGDTIISFSNTYVPQTTDWEPGF